jgi:hypothetical protein
MLLRGQSPSLKFFPPLKHNKKRAQKINLFERGTKGVSTYNQPEPNSTFLDIERLSG